MDNQAILKKIATGDLSGGGILNPVQSETFLNYVIDQSVMKNSARMFKMSAPIMEIDKLGVGARVARPKGEGQAPSTGDFVGVTSTKVTLITKPIIVPRKITRETLQDNIEGDNFESTVLQMIASALANDLEELFLNGDTTSTDTYLQLMDGWLKLMQVGGHDVTIAAGPLVKSTFSKLIKGLPTKFRRNKANLRFFVNSDDEQDYRDSLSSRDTNYGDAKLVDGDTTLIAYGIGIIPVPMLPQGTAILTHRENFIVGMHKEGIRLETDKDIYAGQNEYALHARVACEIENTDAISFTDDITPAP